MNPFEKPSPDISSMTPAKKPKRKSRDSLLSAQDRHRLLDRATILRFTGKSFRQPKDVHGAPLDE